MKKYKINDKFVTLDEFNDLMKMRLPGKYEIVEEEEVTLESLSKKIEELERKVNDQQVQITGLKLENWTIRPLTSPQPYEPMKVWYGTKYEYPYKTNITCSYGNTETKNDIQ